MNPISLFFSKMSLSTVVMTVLIGIAGLLVYQSYDHVATSLGFETKTSLRAKLETAKTQLAMLESANKDLAEKITSQEVRHQKELASVKAVLDNVNAVNTKLAQTKEILTNQNASLKKKLQDDQDRIYTLFNVPKDLYYVYVKQDVNTLSGNNYESLKSFIEDPINGFTPPKPKPEPTAYEEETVTVAFSEPSLKPYEGVI